MLVYYAKEVTGDLRSISESDDSDGGKGQIRDPALQKLKESHFVPSFKAPPGKAGNAELISRLSAVFSDLLAMFGEYTDNSHDEYILKKLLQDRWNDS